MLPAALTIGVLLSGVGWFDQPHDAKPSLAAQATAAGRPKECAPPGRRAMKITVWQKVRYPKLAPYCAQVARAHTLLDSDPKGALAAADAALKDLPGRPGANVARGRALLALDKPEDALAAFEAAKKADDGAIEDPKAMRDFARALVLRSRAKDAAEVYRTLVPRAGLLPAPDRSRALLEAAFASMTAEGGADAKVVPEGRLAEALAYLGEIRESATAPLRVEAILATALVHDRRGDAAKATALGAEAAKQNVDATRSPWVAAPADEHALRALALESRDPSAASEAWSQYLAASPDAGFAAAARSRQAELKRRPAAAPKKAAKKKGPTQ